MFKAVIMMTLQPGEKKGSIDLFSVFFLSLTLRVNWPSDLNSIIC